MVLCAGFGTRLRPLTLERPKPLVPVGDRTILEHACDALAQAGFGSVVINSHHMPELFPPIIEQLALEARVVHEPEILGTAGGIAGARALFAAGPLLVWNGDILASPPIDELLLAVEEAPVALAIAPRDGGEGTVGVDERGLVARLRGHRRGREQAGGDYVGIAALSADAVKQLPARGCLVGDFLLPLLQAGGRVRTVLAHGAWSDAGDPATYVDANLRWLETDPRSTRRGFVGPGAEVAAGVTVVRSVIGPGATVAGEGPLEECVVWPGARAVAPLRRAVVTRGTCVQG